MGARCAIRFFRSSVCLISTAHLARVLHDGETNTPRHVLYGCVEFHMHKRATPIGSEELCELLYKFYSFAIDSFGADRCMFESNFPVHNTRLDMNF